MSHQTWGRATSREDKAPGVGTRHQACVLSGSCYPMVNVHHVCTRVGSKASSSVQWEQQGVVVDRQATLVGQKAANTLHITINTPKNKPFLFGPC